MKTRRLVSVTALFALIGALSLGVPALAGSGDTEVTVGSPPAPFSQNKQNEPAVAINPIDPDVLVAGANDNIDEEACNAGDPTTCPFTFGVGVTGVQISLNGGQSWIQPTYTGYSARNCLGPDPCVPDPDGPIGTLPNYFENGLISDGDPAMVFGPQPDANGDFSWANGARLYFANLTGEFSSKTFKAFEALGVSRTDDVETAAQGGAAGKAAWMDPVVITSFQSANQFLDKEQIWADQVSASDFFGNVYVCTANYHGANNNHTLDVITSSDGGDTWSAVQVVGIAGSNAGQTFGLVSGHSGCTVRTDSGGTVYLFWVGFDQGTHEEGIYMSRSFDGGATFEKGTRLFQVFHTGVTDDVLGRNVMDGIAGARADLGTAPSVDIANGAPIGADATDLIVMTWVDARDGLNNEHVMFTTSDNGGDDWSELRYVEEEIGFTGDRGYYSAPAISPDGTDVYLVYNAFLEPYKTSTIGPANDRPLIGVVAHADAAGAVVDEFELLHRGEPGDARGSSQNDGQGEFLGDYVYADATRQFAFAVWNDVREAADCPAYDVWWMSLRTKTKKDDVPRPEAQQDCPPTFGNSDIWGARFADPT